MTKIDLGEGDAGIVYLSDAVASPGLITIFIPDVFNVIAKYPVAVLDGASEPELGKAFIEFIMSDTGQEILTRWGFIEVTN